MEPFSTSVFKVLIWIVATTTKIYTRHGSTESHDKGFCTVPTALLLTAASYLPDGGWVSAADLSVINFQG